MATDLPISGLPAIPSVVAADKIEVLDVSNVSNHSTGENTFATVTQIAAAIAAINGSGGGSPFVGAGTGHAAGLVPDPGATAHATPYLLGDDGQFHPLAGTALSYSGGTYTFTAGTGGAATPGGSNGDIQINSSGAFGAISSVPVNKGGTGLIVLPTANQLLGVNVGGTAYEGKTLTPGANVTITPSAGALTIAASGGGGGLSNQFTVGNIGNLATGLTPVSIFQSPFAVVGSGSRTIPANTLVAGSAIRGLFYGDIRMVTGDTLTFTVKLGSVTILTGTTSAATVTSDPVNGSQWMIRDFAHTFLTGGATAGSRGNATVAAAASTSGTSLFTGYLTTGGNGVASVNATIDTTAAQTFDILVNFSSANAANLIRILGGFLEIHA